jgi:hypothetical protein
MKETKCQILVGGVQTENKVSDLPHPDRGQPPQSWLLCRVSPPFCHLRELPSVGASTYTALSGVIDGISTIRFDSDSYPIGIDCHASCCMVNSLHLFKNLQLNQGGEVAGINSGLEIKRIGTFKFKVDNNNGKTSEEPLLT